MHLELVPPGLSHTDTLIALWNALLYVGGFLGCCIYPIVSSRYGRRVPLAAAAVCVIIGGALQAAEVNTAMLAVARVITGIGSGSFLPGCPLYQAEVAPAHARGLIIGLHACCIGSGFMVAQWMGAAFFYVEGQVDWRVPLGLQCVSPIALLCIVFFLPESPRWRESSQVEPLFLAPVTDEVTVYMNGNAEKAENVLKRLHHDKADPTSSYPHNEFLLMKAQIDLEAETKPSMWNCVRDPHLRKRFIAGILAASATQASGSIVILSKFVELGVRSLPLLSSIRMTGTKKFQPIHLSFTQS